MRELPRQSHYDDGAEDETDGEENRDDDRHPRVHCGRLAVREQPRDALVHRPHQYRPEGDSRRAQICPHGVATGLDPQVVGGVGQELLPASVARVRCRVAAGEKRKHDLIVMI